MSANVLIEALKAEAPIDILPILRNETELVKMFFDDLKATDEQNGGEYRKNLEEGERLGLE
jgi:hypothetical protein